MLASSTGAERNGEWLVSSVYTCCTGMRRTISRCKAMGITDLRRIYRAQDLAPGSKVIFAATGVTDGTLMKGVRFFGDGVRTSSVIMQNDPHYIRFIDSIHVTPGKDVKIHF